MFHIIFILRNYLLMSQTELAQRASISQRDLASMETEKPHGKIEKYQKLSEFLGVPVEALIKNRPDLIPLSFFDKHPKHSYSMIPRGETRLEARMGEDLIFQREQNRLAAINLSLANLVIPHYKIKGSQPGYDILSFENDGTPYVIEVKTNNRSQSSFILTDNELKTAKAVTDAGFRYVICHISGWNSKKQTIIDRDYPSLMESHTLQPVSYSCTPTSKRTTMNGIAYWRKKRGLRQEDVAKALDVYRYYMSTYETGSVVPSVEFYLRLSEYIEVPVDDLLREYPME